MIKYDSLSISPYGTHSKVTKLVGKNKKVLDIGCATGYLSQEMVDNGCDVIGIEIDKDAAKIASEICKKIYVGEASQIIVEVVEKNFDIILFSDVLEHLVDPISILKKSSSLLAKDGSIIISVPNVAYWKIRLMLLFGNFNYSKIGILDETHLRFFTYKTLRELVIDAGYVIDSIDVTTYRGFPNIPKWRGTNTAKKISYILTMLFKKIFATQFIVHARPIFSDYEESVPTLNEKVDKNI